MKNYFKTSKEDMLAIINEFGIGQAGREEFSKRVEIRAPRTIDPKVYDIDLLRYCERVGGCQPGYTFEYPYQGGTNTAKVCSIYDLPKDMVNPYLYCFSGQTHAPLFVAEALRFYYKQTSLIIPFFSTGLGDNKGMFNPLFHREEGVIIGTEHDFYYKIVGWLLGEEYAYRHYQKSADMSTSQNGDEILNFAMNSKHEEITIVAISGNPYYDKRVISELAYKFTHADCKVKINLVVAHCPIFLDRNSEALPEITISDIMLTYAAASFGPLFQNAISTDGKKTTKAFDKPERYLLTEVLTANPELLRPLFKDFSGQGWPNYQVNILDTDLETAKLNTMMSDYFARTSIDPQNYDEALLRLIDIYQDFVGDFDPKRQTLDDYLEETPEIPFFNYQGPYNWSL